MVFYFLKPKLFYFFRLQSNCFYFRNPECLVRSQYFQIYEKSICFYLLTDFDSNWIWSACIKYFSHSEMTKSINFVTVAPIKIHSNTSIWRSPSAKKLTPSLVDYLLYAHGERRPRARRTHTRARRAPVCVRVGTGAPDACALVTCVLYSTATYTSPV